MFRRRSEDASSATAVADEADKPVRDPQAPKGRPTPKRSEAEASRRTRAAYTAKSGKEAARDQRTRARTEREKQRLAMMNGEERALPPRDKGPVRRFCRDYVDSRFTVAEWFLPLAVIILLLSVMRAPGLQSITLLLWLLMIVVIVLQSAFIGFRLRKALRAKFPDKGPGEFRGAVGYALMRTLQMRRLRLPKPQVKRGQKP
ncbi:DUF3043 domain-containing protein [Phaeacidiphilus oryzae]|uniref:DUF3043 domain-containing protein n=1 Tax=Phaeacidiphilus oryzae TaxID=348818 RepID=UPI0005641091|nr:DUF3043 domain-containing protein [Phaeacidiphilus oryzae]